MQKIVEEIQYLRPGNPKETRRNGIHSIHPYFHSGRNGIILVFTHFHASDDCYLRLRLPGVRHPKTENPLDCSVLCDPASE